MRKTKRYDEGGDVEEAGVGAKNLALEGEEEKSGPSNFKAAFAEARKAGDKTFEYNGKKYTTEVAGERKAAPKREPEPESKPYPEETRAKAKVGAGYENLKSDKPTGPIARTRAGTPVKGREEPSREAVDKAMASLHARMAKQREENKISFKPSKNPNRSYASGGAVSASKRGDGIAQRGKTRGKVL